MSLSDRKKTKMSLKEEQSTSKEQGMQLKESKPHAWVSRDRSNMHGLNWLRIIMKCRRRWTKALCCIRNKETSNLQLSEKVTNFFTVIDSQVDTQMDTVKNIQ